MAIITVEQVRNHLSGPAWNDQQRADCQRFIDGRQARLQSWLRIPIDPIEVTERVRVSPTTGLVMTTYPIHTLIAINDVLVVNGVPPDPYEIQGETWLYDTSYPSQPAYIVRPFTLTDGTAYAPPVKVHYMGGWGDQPDLVATLLDKVGNCMLNRHDDTVIARNLDAEKPVNLNEDWTDQELLMLRARRRPVGARSR
jgi:hypothetical protein